MNICQGMIDGSRIFPEEVAIVCGEENYTYADIARLSACAASRLEAAGIGKGDRVALFLGNTPAFAVW